MRILNVVGARPNFMKIAPVIEALNHFPDAFQHRLLHTGQHYDERMSGAFFEVLGIPKPDIDLGVGSGSHAEQTGRVMIEFEKVCLNERPDLTIVVGDVNSTMACAITAKKLGIAVAHVEAGLRSRDMTMPEEINRLCTDAVSDHLFTTDTLADDNLRREGISEEKIHFVGNVMIDTLLKHKAAAEQLGLLKELGLMEGQYATLTLHRPSNVDDYDTLRGILEAVIAISQRVPVLFPIHPRTRKMLGELGLEDCINTGATEGNLRLTEPMDYLEMLHLNMHARMILTDSGGIQEEATALGVPCLTLRHNTERPITCTQGTNQLVGNDRDTIVDAAKSVLASDGRPVRVPDKWDGRAAERIVQVLLGSAGT